MDEILKILKDIGFKDNEISVYVSALKYGANPASILGKKSDISRANTQYICAKLVDRGVLSMVETSAGNIYSAEQPDKILSMLGREYNKLDKKMDQARRVIPLLSDLVNPHSKVPKVKYFSGVEGMIELFDDVFKEKKKVYGAIEVLDSEVHPDLSRYIQNEYIPKRIRLGIETQVIFNDNKSSIDYTEHDVSMNRRSVIISKELFPFESCIHIYGDKVAFFSYKIDDMTGVLIENKFIVQAMQSLFKMSWNFAISLPENKLYKNDSL